MKRAIRKESWLTFLVCTVAGLLIIWDTLGYPPVKGQGFGQGPAFYPQVLAAALIALGALIILTDRISGELPSGGPSFAYGARYAPVFLLTFLSVALIGLMRYTGFFISGFLLAFFTSLLIRGELRKRTALQDLLFSAGIIALVYIVFEVFVGIVLPRSEIL